MRKLFFCRKSGFTLIEAVVVIGISVILTSVLYGYTRNSEKNLIFFKEKTLLVNTLQRAKALAVETFLPQIQPGLQNVGSVETICGWGVHFDIENTKFLLFRDLADQTGKCKQNAQYDGVVPGVGNEDFEIFNIDPSVSITCIALNSDFGSPCAQSGNIDRDVIFVPPQPVVKFFPPSGPVIPQNNNPPPSAPEELVIDLESLFTASKVTIRITSSGQINF